MFHELMQSIRCDPEDSEIVKAYYTHLLAYDMTKLGILSESLLDVEQNVSYRVTGFHRTSRIMAYFNRLFKLHIPMFITYGFKVILEPQSLKPLRQDHEMVKSIKEKEEIEYEQHCPKDI